MIDNGRKYTFEEAKLIKCRKGITAYKSDRRFFHWNNHIFRTSFRFSALSSFFLSSMYPPIDLVSYCDIPSSSPGLCTSNSGTNPTFLIRILFFPLLSLFGVGMTFMSKKDMAAQTTIAISMILQEAAYFYLFQIASDTGQSRLVFST
ncbi:hypothetical protein HDU76_010027, partial [Blyttiomyces sp. JEL0837]